MFGLIGMIIVGGIIGWIGLILGKDVPGGILGNIIAGIGSWVGTMILGEWGPLGKIHIFPALLGSIILIFIISLILKALRKNNKYRLSLI